MGGFWVKIICRVRLFLFKYGKKYFDKFVFDGVCYNDDLYDNFWYSVLVVFENVFGENGKRIFEVGELLWMESDSVLDYKEIIVNYIDDWNEED